MGPRLPDVIAALERIAPPVLAGDWDNVGTLVDGAQPDAAVERCLLTIDLDEAVVDEAIAGGHSLIVAYHPPIFAKLRRLRAEDPGQRVLLKAVRAGIAIYSPHTALDATPGGVNDWLADGLGAGTRRSLEPDPGRRRRYLEARLDSAAASAVSRALSGVTEVDVAVGDSGEQTLRCELSAAAELALTALPAEIRSRCEIVTRVSPAAADRGQGRGVRLAEPASLDQVITRIKQHLGLQYLRVARAARHAAGEPIQEVALCAGSGNSVISRQPADLYWTGEMSHHDVLAAVRRGASVVLCDHSNTERGYLPLLRERLLEEVGDGLQVDISTADREPLEIV